MKSESEKLIVLALQTIISLQITKTRGTSSEFAIKRLDEAVAIARTALRAIENE